MKTAVDWLIEELKPTEIGSIEWYNAIEQANEMFRKQIIEARVTAPIIDTTNKENYQTEAENYYQETYGTTNT